MCGMQEQLGRTKINEQVQVVREETCTQPRCKNKAMKEYKKVGKGLQRNNPLKMTASDGGNGR